MTIGSKRLVAWDNSRHAPEWQFNIHDGTAETGSSGIIYIVRHQVLYNLLEHGTSSMGRHLLAKVHITKLNELTVSEGTKLSSSTVNETALAMLKLQGTRGIPIFSLQRKSIFTIQVLSILTELTDTTL
jgi:hypothetical protein